MAIFSLIQSAGLFLVGVALYNVALTIYRLYFHPLSKFPGPKLAAATQWYEIYYDIVKVGQFIWEIQRMHERYGPIVRINPDEVHIKDPEFYDEIYAGATKKRDKYDKWIMMAGAPRSAFSTTEHDLHRQRRAALNPFFAKRSVIRLEPRISEKVRTLCGRLAECMKDERVVDLHTAFMALTTDIITEYCYSKSYDFLNEDDFKQEWKDCMTDLFDNATFRRAVPWLTYTLQRIPADYVLKLMPKMGLLINWQKDIKKEVEGIVNKKETTEEKESIFKALRDNKELPKEEKSVQRLTDEGEILIGAGSETTAKTLAITTFYILHTPNVLQTLREELKTVMPRSTDMPAWTDLEKLPYLTAVVQEGLRLSFGVSTRLPRVTHEALRYGNWVIPPRTPISQTTYFIHIDPAIFPSPFDFKPDRWFKQVNSNRLDRYLVSFSKGTRACLGINLAYAELFLTLASMFRRFDLELYKTSIEDVMLVRDMFMPAPRIESKGVRIIVKGEVD